MPPEFSHTGFCTYIAPCSGPSLLNLNVHFKLIQRFEVVFLCLEFALKN